MIHLHIVYVAARDRESAEAKARRERLGQSSGREQSEASAPGRTDEDAINAALSLVPDTNEMRKVERRGEDHWGGKSWYQQLTCI